MPLDSLPRCSTFAPPLRGHRLLLLMMAPDYLRTPQDMQVIP
jgi:hypothetical protein